MIEDEIISQQPLTAPSEPVLNPAKRAKMSRFRLVILLGLPLILFLAILLYLNLASPPHPTLPPSSTGVPTPIPTLIPPASQTYPFATDSALLKIEASVSGTIDPNINQLLHLLQLPDINHPTNF